MKNRIAFLIFKILSLLPLGSLRVLGVAFGYVNWILHTRAKRTTLTNLNICFPEMTKVEQQRLAKRSLSETMKTLLECGKIWRSEWRWLETKIVSVSGKDILSKKINRQRTMGNTTGFIIAVNSN